jgi:hypothetical protein
MTKHRSPRLIRTRAGFGSADLSDHASSMAPAINGMTFRKQNPTWAVLSSLADVLDIELLDLVRLAGEQPSRHLREQSSPRN